MHPKNLATCMQGFGEEQRPFRGQERWRGIILSCRTSRTQEELEHFQP